jgi:hypothetical protein
VVNRPDIKFRRSSLVTHIAFEVIEANGSSVAFYIEYGAGVIAILLAVWGSFNA